MRSPIKCILIATLAMSASCFAASEKKIENMLKPWEPLSVTVRDSRLTVVSKEKQVNDTIYQAILTGVCTTPVNSPGAITGIKEIAVMNKFSAQGYVFEGGASECLELANMPYSKVKIWLLSRTHAL